MPEKSNYIISCCSTADMPASFFEERDIPYACFHYSIDGVEYPDDLGKTISFEDFYEKIAAGALPVTSQVNTQQYIDMFEPLLKQGKDILHISLSSGISGSYNSAKAAQSQLSDKYPERKLLVVDSLAASSGYGMLVDAAWELRSKGGSIDEVFDWLEENKLHLHHWFLTTDLRHYRRGGRISASSAVLGMLLNICPLMDVNDEGKLTVREKVRGKKRVLVEIVNKMEQFARDKTDYSGKCFISHSACYEDAQTVANLIEDIFPRLDGRVQINSVGAVIGSHTGPGTVALYFWGNKRSK